MDRVWDARGEAKVALETVVTGFGAAVLGQADMLEGLLQDDIPQLPREVAMLTETARYGVAALLAERVRQGISAPAAVTLVATEMTSRTAVDSTGALWAAGVFANAIGLSSVATTAPPVVHDQGSGDLTVPPPTSATQQDLRGSDPTVVGHGISSEPETRRVSDSVPEDHTRTGVAPRTGVGGYNWPDQFGQVGQLADQGASSLRAAGASATGLAVASAIGMVVSVMLLGFWVLTGLNAPEDVRNWGQTLPLAIGGIAIGVWALRSSATGTGIAAVFGLAVPTASFAIYNAAIGAEFTSEPTIERYFVVGTSALAVLAAGVAGIAAAGALGRRQLPGRYKQPGLSAILSGFGLGFVASMLFGQIRFEGVLVGNVEGSGVRSWFVLWGLIFLALYAIPPIVSFFFRPGSSAQIALWSGWLVAVLAWQISDSPVDGLTPAFGLGLTWFCWLAALICMIALAVRRNSAPVQPGPWQVQ